EKVLATLGTATDLLLRAFPKGRAAQAEQGDGVVLRVVVFLLVVFLAAPALLMIPMSFDSASGLAWPPKGFSLQWYQQ
ncbi:ABC transporter permease subunit, partial [Pandoraea pneumonica]